MRQLYDDLWETSTFSPFPGLTTHGYLWLPADGDNVLFYAPGSDDEFEAMQRLGGVAHQYLSHQDEAGPALALVADRFGTKLHAPAGDLEAVRRFAEPHVILDRRHVDENDVEIVPTPGHTAGSTCFVVPGAGHRTYLFTGDTIYRGRDGRWSAGYIGGVSDRDALVSSLELLGTLQPDVVISSAFTGDDGAHPMHDTDWSVAVAQALEGLRPEG